MPNWLKIDEHLPEEKKPVFLIAKNEETISQADLGYIVNKQGKGWLVDTISKY